MEIQVEHVGPLTFVDGSPVRAASAIAAFGDSWLVLQDDSTYAAWIRPDGVHRLRLLPSVDGHDVFDEASGTKHLKPDLEAACPVLLGDGSAVLVLGSGSSDRRMRGCLVHGSEDRPEVAVADLEDLYASVARALELPADQLNLEGACLVNGELRWFHRGLPSAGLPTASVALDLSQLLAAVSGEADPARVVVRDARTYDLGSVRGVGLAVTDAAHLPDGLVLVSAAAEATKDPRDDGPVVGSSLAVIEDHQVVSCAPLPAVGDRVPKVEGLAVLERDDSSAYLLATVDADDPGTPSSLLRVRVSW